jgi:hypothetical protein
MVVTAPYDAHDNTFVANDPNVVAIHMNTFDSCRDMALPQQR